MNNTAWLIFGFVAFLIVEKYLSGLFEAWREDRAQRRRVHEFKAIYANPLNALQWSVFLGDRSKDGWEFVCVVYETVALTTEKEAPGYAKTIAIFRRLKLKGEK